MPENPSDDAQNPSTEAQTGSSEQQPSTAAQAGAKPQPNDGGDSSSPSTDDPTQQSQGLAGAGLKYPDDYPVEWLRGKTADEAAELANTLYQSMLQGNQIQQPQQQQQATQPQQQPSPQQTQPQPVQQPQQEQTPAPPDPDLIYSDKAEYNRQLTNWQQQVTQSTIQQAAQPMYQPLAQMARNNARNNSKYEDVWEAYGPEIDAVMQQVPAQNRTNEQLWQQATQMVAGQHFDELAQKKAEKLATNPPQATISSSGDGPPQPAASGGKDPIDQLFAENHPSIHDYKKDNISPDQVKKHARAMGKSVEQHAEDLKKRHLIRSKQFTTD